MLHADGVPSLRDDREPHCLLEGRVHPLVRHHARIVQAADDQPDRGEGVCAWLVASHRRLAPSLGQRRRRGQQVRGGLVFGGLLLGERVLRWPHDVLVRLARPGGPAAAGEDANSQRHEAQRACYDPRVGRPDLLRLGVRQMRAGVLDVLGARAGPRVGLRRDERRRGQHLDAEGPQRVGEARELGRGDVGHGGDPPRDPRGVGGPGHNDLVRHVVASCAGVVGAHAL
mmetsp:Transcript_25019/g.75179  ORF Transcript_25019/g.75179 Transcript_25019/m.75179 type:complete len:228 (+) Transcript_25019:152-835(+)